MTSTTKAVLVRYPNEPLTLQLYTPNTQSTQGMIRTHLGKGHVAVIVPISKPSSLGHIAPDDETGDHYVLMGCFAKNRWTVLGPDLFGPFEHVDDATFFAELHSANEPWEILTHTDQPH